MAAWTPLLDDESADAPGERACVEDNNSRGIPSIRRGKIFVPKNKKLVKTCFFSFMTESEVRKIPLGNASNNEIQREKSADFPMKTCFKEEK